MSKFHLEKYSRDSGVQRDCADRIVGYEDDFELATPDEGNSRPAVRNVLKIGLLNNMRGAAKRATELHFRRLLARSSGPCPLRLLLFSPPSISGADQTRYDLKFGYSTSNSLWNSKLDALIITGMEPNTADLRQELLWSFFVDVFDWAEFNAVPTVLSCLAAHAAVLHTDGIIRIPLPIKRFGIFQHNVVSKHPLARGLPSSLRVPHSRWNELDKNMLADYGYQVLTYSAQAGVDIFVKQRRSLFVHFQGHPEYGLETLFGEYRRDIRRFLAGEQDSYPSLPEGYFNKAAEARLNAFRERAFRERREELWQQFPRQLAPTDRTAPWGAAATKIIHNLLNYIGERND